MSKHNRLSEYYNEANECLEHYKFKEIFIRRTKKAFISFAPKNAYREIAKSRPIKCKDSILSKLSYGNLTLNYIGVHEA